MFSCTRNLVGQNFPSRFCETKIRISRFVRSAGSAADRLSNTLLTGMASTRKGAMNRNSHSDLHAAIRAVYLCITFFSVDIHIEIVMIAFSNMCVRPSFSRMTNDII